MSELDMNGIHPLSAEAFAAESYITESAATLILAGRGKEAVAEYLDRHPLEDWHYLVLLWEIDRFIREAE